MKCESHTVNIHRIRARAGLLYSASQPHIGVRRSGSTRLPRRWRSIVRLLLNLSLRGLLLALPGTAMAQDATAPDAPPPPLTVVHAEGRVETVRSDGVLAVQVPDLLEEDDRLVTGDGRAELAYADGSLVHVDRETDLRIDPGVRLRLVRGRIVVHTTGDGELIVVATPAGLVRLDTRGTFDVSANDLGGDTAVAVLEGRASLLGSDRDLPIGTGDELRIDPRDLQPRWARATPPDAFRTWADGRAADAARAVRGTPVPAYLTPYAAQLSTHGQWDTIAPYGAVWLPTAGPRVAPLYQRLVALHAVRVDVDRRRSLGVADASLRALGPPRSPRLVLDPAAPVGSRLGRLGHGRRPCGLVAARLERASRRGLLRGRTDRPARRVGQLLVGAATPRLRRTRTGRTLPAGSAAAAGAGARWFRFAAGRSARAGRGLRPLQSARPALGLAGGRLTTGRSSVGGPRAAGRRAPRPARRVRPGRTHASRRRRTRFPDGRRARGSPRRQRLVTGQSGPTPRRCRPARSERQGRREPGARPHPDARRQPHTRLRRPPRWGAAAAERDPPAVRATESRGGALGRADGRARALRGALPAVPTGAA